MLKLKNIKQTDKTIEADYTPEQSNKTAHVFIDMTNGKGNADIIDEFGTMYSRMAINGLQRILAELKRGTITEIPNSRIVMWF